jgi:hypothetical protein
LGSREADHHPHHRPRGVELAALPLRGVGELTDEVLVGGPEEVGELEVLVAEPVAVEVIDELPEPLVGDPRLPDRAVEIDVVEDAFQGGVRLFESAEGQQAVTAVGRELLGFIWAIGVTVERQHGAAPQRCAA